MMSRVTQDGRRGRLIGRAAMERLLTFPPTTTAVAGSGNGDDLREEDVWGNYSADPPAVTATASASAAASPARRRRWFEKGGLSAAFEDTSAATTTRSPISALRAIPATSRVAPAPPPAGSAPVNVPEWGSGGLLEFRYVEDDDDEDYVDVDEESYFGGAANTKRVPPHEYLAAQAARSGTKTMSVLEGVGRTLKGRDMSRVRDAVWNQTGFLG